MAKILSYKDLKVWEKAHELVLLIYRLTAKFPKTESFALIDQIKRAATSIVLNIAEGSGQPTKKSFCLYLERSKSSLLEVVACLRIATQEEMIKSSDTANIEGLLQELYFKIIALRKSMIVPR